MENELFNFSKKSNPLEPEYMGSSIGKDFHPKNITMEDKFDNQKEPNCSLGQNDRKTFWSGDIPK
jgi:hypothetical protein